MRIARLRDAGEYAAEPAGHVQPEVILGCEVLHRAMIDACNPPDDGRRRGRLTDGFATGVAERLNAWAFLTDLAGPWAASRREWCIAAGIEEDAVRRAALKRGKHPALVAHEQERERSAAA